jgi:hypothetical protein
MVVHGSCVYVFIEFDSVFDLKYLSSGRQPTVRQLDKLRWERIYGALISSLGLENM